jgi:hypothetical protein
LVHGRRCSDCWFCEGRTNMMCQLATGGQEPMRLQFQGSDVLINICTCAYLLQVKNVTPTHAAHCGTHFQMLSPYSSAAPPTALCVGNPLEISPSAKAVKTSHRNTTTAQLHKPSHHPTHKVRSQSHSRTTLFYFKSTCK